jgi:hypothetical protein
LIFLRYKKASYMKPGSHMAALQAAPTSPAKPVHKQGKPKSPRKNFLFDGFPTMETLLL